MARLSLCMIVRNEAEMLPGCLESVRDIVDEIIIVDTGSTDATREIAKRYKAKVLQQAWNDDFATPRNEALQHATGEFILQLDADERLSKAGRAQLKRALERTDFDLAIIPLHNASERGATEDEILSGAKRAGEPIHLPRLFRNIVGAEYRGIVHEGVAEWFAENDGRFCAIPVDLTHYGAIPELRQERGKNERNFALLRKRISLEPGSIVAYGYLALDLVKAGEMAKAKDVITDGWRLIDTQPKYRSRQRLAVARAFHGLATGRPEVTIDTAETLKTYEPLGPDMAHLVGCALELLALRQSGSARRKLLQEALKAQEDALAFADKPVPDRYVAGASSYAAELRRATGYLLLEKPTEALASARTALTAAPDNREAQLVFAEALLDAGQAATALAVTEKQLDDRPDGWLIAAAAALALQSPNDAQMLLGQARARIPRGFVGSHRRLRFEAMTRQ